MKFQLYKFAYSPGLLMITIFLFTNVYAKQDEGLSGKELMEQVYERHQAFPYIYEEQSIVLIDRNGKKDSRRAKRYSRMEEDGSVKFLLLFDYPEEIRGVAVLAERNSDGNINKYLYLPAFGEQLLENVGGTNENNFLGTDFSVENLTGENLDDYHYERREDRIIDDQHFLVVDVYDNNIDIDMPIRRHFINFENLFITKTHHFDRLGRISRVQSQHDLKAVDGNMWRANMMLMDDKKENHRSLIKVSHRVFSKDYVPEEVFEAAWLYKQYPYIEPEQIEVEEIINIFGEEVLQ